MTKVSPALSRYLADSVENPAPADEIVGAPAVLGDAFSGSTHAADIPHAVPRLCR